MKNLLLITLTLSLTLAQTMQANSSKAKNRRAEVDVPQSAPAQAVRRPAPRTAQRPTTQRTQNSLRPSSRVPASSRSAAAPSRARLQANNRPTSDSRVTNSPVARQLNTTGLRRNGDPNFRSTSRTRNGVSPANRGRARNVDPNSFANARTRVIRTRHDRGWWRSHYNTTFILFGGGYYYWDAGYWFPAYGYDPYYNSYAYDEPIYGYNDLDPGQVLENVQIALRDEGYYRGAIDGLIGPQTRAALAAFQRDNGLVETAAVDEPTLVTLGLA